MRKESHIIFFAFGFVMVLLFGPIVIGFRPDQMLGSIPSLYVYLMGIWVAMILWVALRSRKGSQK